MVESEQGVVVAAKLTKVFRDFWLREKVTAVAELDLEVMPREVFGLLGPNGSGKSTTIKMVLGLLFPTRGRIAVFGRAATDVATKARIGFLPEETYLYPFLDAHETLDFYGRLFHQPRRERHRRIGMLLDMVGLTSVAYRRVGEYSKGMQRRIGLAQALINDPELLILDEPTSGMDPIGARQFKDLIRTLAARGKTVILSSHLLADVEDVCDRVCILYGGRSRAVGRIDEMLAQTSLTQLTTSRLDEPTLAKIRKVLVESGNDMLDVTTPRDRLESLFLRMVQEAQEQNIRTGGALAGGGVAEFLRVGQTTGQSVIDDLLAAAKAGVAKEPEPPPAPEASPESVKEVIQELMGAKADTEKSRPQPPPRPMRDEAPKPDRGVIDDLLKGGGHKDASK
jgi:ABC-2 type transport system ATP-binding protein